MSASVTPITTRPFAGFHTRSLGAKFFLLMALAVLMSIPGLFVSGLASERASQRSSPQERTKSQTSAPSSVLGIRLADSYRSTQRSLKYITLFLGLVFLTYFLFEISSGKRVHPGQYALVGVAQTIFYLLLLSLAERIGFDLGFLLAGAATVLLFAFNAEWVFTSRKLGLRALAVFSLLYAFIYALLRLEDYALLVGASASFIAVAAAMYFTRNIDWYSAVAISTPAPASPAAREGWLE